MTLKRVQANSHEKRPQHSVARHLRPCRQQCGRVPDAASRHQRLAAQYRPVVESHAVRPLGRQRDRCREDGTARRRRRGHRRAQALRRGAVRLPRLAAAGARGGRDRALGEGDESERVVLLRSGDGPDGRHPARARCRGIHRAGDARARGRHVAEPYRTAEARRPAHRDRRRSRRRVPRADPPRPADHPRQAPARPQQSGRPFQHARRHRNRSVDRPAAAVCVSAPSGRRRRSDQRDLRRMPAARRFGARRVRTHARGRARGREGHLRRTPLRTRTRRRAGRDRPPERMVRRVGDRRLTRRHGVALLRRTAFLLSCFPAFLLSCFPAFPLSRFPAFPLSRFPAFLLSCFPRYTTTAGDAYPDAGSLSVQTFPDFT
ncbi:hypothetical protein F01_410443 [Burkholderia cenocepacia]|nr:hypothetical protein F01_410443 [Burkholderia cenocepacia]